MSFAEIILRVGVSVGGWLIFLGHALLIAAIPAADCDPSSDEMWRGTLLFGVLAVVAVMSGGVGLLWRDSLRPLAVIAILLALYALFRLAPAISSVVFGDGALASICGTESSVAGGEVFTPRVPTRVEVIWIPAQLLILLIGVFQGIRFCLPANAVDSGPGHNP